MGVIRGSAGNYETADRAVCCSSEINNATQGWNLFLWRKGFPGNQLCFYNTVSTVSNKIDKCRTHLQLHIRIGERIFGVPLGLISDCGKENHYLKRVRNRTNKVFLCH